MKLALYTISISPHITSYWKIFSNLWADDVYYFYKTAKHDIEREKIGWQETIISGAKLVNNSNYVELESIEILIETMRDMTLIEKRLRRGLLTIYCSERWFKPPLGFCRVFMPSYFKMTWRFVKCFKHNAFTYFPQGIHAARDMARLVAFLHGDVRCLFRAPKVAFESRPGGAIVPLKEAIGAGVLSKEEIAFGRRYGFVQIPREHWGKVKPQGIYAKMRLWGYFVEPGREASPQLPVASSQLPVGVDAQDCQGDLKTTEYTEDTENGADAQTRNWEQGTGNCAGDAPRLRVLWVGRMLDWKRVDTLVKACVSDVLKDKVELHLYGHGPEEEKLKRLATAGNNVFFHDFVPVAQVRDLMQSHNVYVLPSDGGEGWGAVVSEALEEGMQVLGTTGAGSSATILPPSHLFKAGDVKHLCELLNEQLSKVTINEWTSESAAKTLKNLLLIIGEHNDFYR